MNYELSLKFSSSDADLDASVLDKALALFVEGADTLSLEKCLGKTPQAEETGPNDNPGDAPSSENAATPSGNDWMPGQKLNLKSLMAPLATDDRPIQATRQNTSVGMPWCIDVSLSFEMRDEAAFEKAFLHTMHFAALINAQVIDPQISGDVTEKSLSSAREQWLQMRGWLLRTDGRSALLAPPDAPLTLPEPTFFERHAKVILIGAGILLFLGILQRLIQFLTLAWS